MRNTRCRALRRAVVRNVPEVSLDERGYMYWFRRFKKAYNRGQDSIRLTARRDVSISVIPAR